MPSKEEIVHELPMRWADLDSLNHVNNVVYVDYASEVRDLLVEDGLIEAGLGVSHMSVRYSRPMLLSRHPVVVTSVIDGDKLTQQICSDRDGTRTVYSTLVTTLGTPSTASRSAVTSDPLPSRIRRSDIDSTGAVSLIKTFELFQEGRVLFISNHLAGLKSGQFVVGTVSVDFHSPITWRLEPYESRSWLSRVGAGSVTIESELSDGDVLLARGTTFLVGFDLAAQKSRAFSPEERAVFDGLKASGGPA
ncbi:acyl-CoA thioester hydrolase [Aeromicrobium panaciterrae]|uniref:Acyl-CoA thioester hydrolase n=1 Tax=Aeromicrobium panaciterrae TaxID=363861 RepID=A0ABU1UMS6_9ACTN|nr:thioesterase family protein [Aeromicrobium panaciterrae]MDR7086484.1 acyl-CoA thioester hydrolase [Aeromicrobium panaciterrae]